MGSMMSTFARPIEFVDENDTPQAIDAIVGEIRTEYVEDGQGIRKRRVRHVTVTADPDGDFGGVGTININKQSIFIIDTETWAVDNIEEQSPSMIKFLTERTMPFQRSDVGYRKQG